MDISSDDVNVDGKRKEKECAKSVTQCAKAYGSDEGGKVFSHFYFFCNCEVKKLNTYVLIFLYRVWFCKKLLDGSRTTRWLHQ